jgi:L-aminopeptidase/D-esterase-like protein
VADGKTRDSATYLKGTHLISDVNGNITVGNITGKMRKMGKVTQCGVTVVISVISPKKILFK